MKTKNVRVRVKDIKQGVRVFVSHPFFGIQTVQINSKPFLGKYSPSLWAKSLSECGEQDFSLVDAGVTSGESCNDRRTFFKRKQAEEWAKKMCTDKEVVARHKAHLQSCKEFNTLRYQSPRLLTDLWWSH